MATSVRTSRTTDLKWSPETAIWSYSVDNVYWVHPLHNVALNSMHIIQR